MAVLAILLLVMSSICFRYSLASSPDVRIVNAERRIDLTSPIVREALTLKVEYIGPSQTSEILLAFSLAQTKHIALLQASTTEGKSKRKKYVPLDVSPTESPQTPNDAKLFTVSLINPLKNGESAMLEVLLVLTHVQEPFPSEISQSESQLVCYRDSAVIFSPYEIKDQITYIKTPTKKVESYSRVDPISRVGTELRYGHYYDSPAYSFSPILVHFENNHPFAVVEQLVRVVEISHWGSLQVTENYKLVHAGARHKGVFSRLEYQAGRGASSFKQFLARLPPRVQSVYYRDEIGNISSSHLRSDSQKSELEIEPRYPLFGGWKASFTIGYSLPLQDYLFESPDGRRYLNFNYGCSLLETLVDELTTKVVLPEGSKEPSLSTPFQVDQHLETTFSYLDVVGRQTVVLKKQNVVPEHNIPFQVYYTFNPIFMFAEPLMLIFTFFLIFIAFIAFLHTDLSIRKAVP